WHESRGDLRARVRRDGRCMMAAPNDQEARAMTLLTLSGRIRELAETLGGPAERVALLEEASVRLFAAALLVNGVPTDGPLASAAFVTEENLRELLHGGVAGNFGDISGTMHELEDRMRREGE